MKFVRVVAILTISLIAFKKSVAQPLVNSISPATAIPGASVTIAGSNFNSAPGSNVVYFGSIRASITIVVTTSLTVDLHKRRL